MLKCLSLYSVFLFAFYIVPCLLKSELFNLVEKEEYRLQSKIKLRINLVQ